MFYLALLFYLGFILLLIVVPYWFPVDKDVASAASVEGYNNCIAYYVAVMWSISGIVMYALLKEEQESSRNRIILYLLATLTLLLHPMRKRFPVVEVAVVFLCIILLYNPVFLSKYGPYIEDHVFLNALHRMHAGQQPYVDFEFLYGPLMLYPAHLWTNVFGYSLTSYYSYFAILEALTFAVLISVLHLYFPKVRSRYFVFFLIAILICNTLLAPNQNGMRKLLPVFIILLITSNPRSMMIVIIGSLILGLQLSYSHDYGVSAFLSILAMFGLLIVKEVRFKYVPLAIMAIIFSVLSWYISSTLIMEDGFSSYVTETLYLINRFSIGEAGFRFYWTVNTLALFGLLCLSCIIVGQGMSKIREKELGSGDLFLFCGLIYVLIGLKGGLNRCDLWHVNPPFLVLIFSFLLPLSRTLFTYSKRVKKIAVTLIVIIALTYLVGQAPSGSYYVSGLLRGLWDTITFHDSSGRQTVNTRAPMLGYESSNPLNPETLRLAEFLANDAMSNLPVLFYGDTWSLGKVVGVYKTDFINDDFLYSDERGSSVKGFLQEKKCALIIMSRHTYNRIFGFADPLQYPEFRKWYKPTITKSISSWLSSVHYKGVEIEIQVKDKRWKRTVGDYIKSCYKSIAEFGDYIVLTRIK